ncbi:MAG: hypothetical protein LUM44_04895 [Pyrinomonadaceae bacterium]|nr:hypothetical protein [Pyrinomonadaceae bacterium]
MIKSLLNADEEPSPKKESVATDNFANLSLIGADEPEKASENPPQVETEMTVDESGKEENAENLERAETSEIKEPESARTEENPRNVFEIPEDAKFFAKPETLDDRLEKISLMSENELEKLLEDEEETYKILTRTDSVAPDSEEKKEIENSENLPVFSSDAVEEKPETETKSTTMFDFEPETQADTMRKSGLAYSAAIVLFASVIFTMILGWFADLLLGSSPWGIVGGIILGGFIGFIQFFRIASSIFKK